MEDKRLYGIEDLVRVLNPDNEDFNFMVAGVPYVIKAGEAGSFLGYQADLAIKHLMDKLMTKDKKRTPAPHAMSGEVYWWHVGGLSEPEYELAKEYFDKIYVGKESVQNVARQDDNLPKTEETVSKTEETKEAEFPEVTAKSKK